MVTHFSYSGDYLEELSEAMFVTMGYLCEKINTVIHAR